MLKRNFELRDYQKEAKKEILEQVRNYFRSKINLENNSQTYKSGNLLEMATGSGKTLVSGDTVSYIIEVKDRLGEKLGFGGLNIVVLTNRIDGINQFRDDWLHGRGDKKAIFPKEILEKIESMTFHSCADNLDEYEEVLDDEIENFGENKNQNGKNKHKIFFSTYQTAKLKKLSEKIKDIDMIIIDEAHNVASEKSSFGKVLKELEKNGRSGFKPIILAVTDKKEKNSEKLTKQEVIDYFQKKGLDYWIDLSKKYREGLKIKRKGLAAIARLFGVKGDPIGYNKVWFELLGKIFNLEVEELINFKAKKLEEEKEKIIRYFKKKGLKYWINLNIKERNDLKINQKGLFAISSMFGIKGNPIGYNEVWIKFLERIFDTKVDAKTEIIDYFKGKELDYWVYLKRKDRKILKIEQKGLLSISSIFGIKGNPINNTDVWIELLEKIFDIKIDIKGRIINSFQEKGLDYWENLTVRERLNLKINGKGLNAISKLFGIKGDTINNKKFWYKLLEKIFDTKIEYKDLSKEEVIDFFQKKELYYWVYLKRKEKQDLKIKQKGLVAIARLFGVKGNPIGYNEVWIELLEKIFNVKVEEFTDYKTRKLTEEKEKIIKHFKEKELNYWIYLKIRKRANLKINGYGLLDISKLFGFKGDPLINKEIWIKLLEKIFDTKIGEIRLTKEVIEDYFKDKGLDYWEKYNHKFIRNIRVYGKTLKDITPLFGIKLKHSEDKENWKKFLEKIFKTEVKLKK